MKRIIIAIVMCVFFAACQSPKPSEAAQMVIDEIAQLSESKDYSLKDIEKLKERYNSLPDSQKEQVSNYAALLKMEDELNGLIDGVIDAAEFEKTHYPEGTEFLLLTEVVNIDLKFEEEINYIEGNKNKYNHYYKFSKGSDVEKIKKYVDTYRNYLKDNFTEMNDKYTWYEDSNYNIAIINLVQLPSGETDIEIYINSD